MFRVRSENFSSSAEQSADSRCGPVFSHRVLGECGILNGTMIKWNWQQQARIIYRGPEKARKRVLSCPALCFSNLTLSWKSSSRVLSMTPSGGGDCLFFFFSFLHQRDVTHACRQFAHVSCRPVLVAGLAANFDSTPGRKQKRGNQPPFDLWRIDPPVCASIENAKLRHEKRKRESVTVFSIVGSARILPDEPPTRNFINEPRKVSSACC